MHGAVCGGGGLVVALQMIYLSCDQPKFISIFCCWYLNSETFLADTIGCDTSEHLTTPHTQRQVGRDSDKRRQDSCDNKMVKKPINPAGPAHLSSVCVGLRVMDVGDVVVAGVCQAGVLGNVAIKEANAAPHCPSHATFPSTVTALHWDTAWAGNFIQIEQRAHATASTVRAFENFEIHFAGVCWFCLRGSGAHSILIGSSVGSARDTEDIDRIKILSLIAATLRRFGRHRIWCCAIFRIQLWVPLKMPLKLRNWITFQYFEVFSCMEHLSVKFLRFALY